MILWALAALNKDFALNKDKAATLSAENSLIHLVRRRLLNQRAI